MVISKGPRLKLLFKIRELEPHLFADSELFCDFSFRHIAENNQH